MAHQSHSVRTLFFSKEDTQILKGIAIIMMVFHHCFGFSWYSIPLDFSIDGIQWDIARYCKVCIFIFAFITGWTYAHHREKTMLYSLRKIITFLLSCLFIVLLLHGIMGLLMEHSPHLIDIRGEFSRVGGKARILMYGWYIPFYVLMMLLLPCVAAIEGCKHYLAGIVAIILMTLTFASALPVLSIEYMLPVPLLGYYAAKTNFLERLWDNVPSSAIVRVLIAIVMICISYIIFFEFFPGHNRSFLVSLSVIPLFIGYKCLSSLLQLLKLNSILIFMGIHSMNIWFIHCIFHGTTTRSTIQNLFFVFPNGPWIFATTLLVSLILSILFKPFQDRVVTYLTDFIFAEYSIKQEHTLHCFKFKLRRIIPFIAIVSIIAASYEVWYREGYYLTFKYEMKNTSAMRVYWNSNAKDNSWDRFKSTRVFTFSKQGEALVFLPAQKIAKVRLDLGNKPGSVKISDVMLHGSKSLPLFSRENLCKTNNIDSIVNEGNGVHLLSNQNNAYITHKDAISISSSKVKQFSPLRFLLIALGAWIVVHLLKESQRSKPEKI